MLRAEPPQATPNPVALEVPSGDGTAVRLTTELGDVVIGGGYLTACHFTDRITPDAAKETAHHANLRDEPIA